MGRFEELGSELTLDYGDKLRRNFDRADADLTSQQSQITAEQQARIAADTAHASSGTAHDADSIGFAPGSSGLTATKAGVAIREVNSRVTNIIAGPAPSAAEVQDIRLGADGVARASAGAMVREIHAQQIAANVQTIALKHGWNNIQASEASSLAPTVYGRTLVNLVGRAGNFETDSNGDGVADGWSNDFNRATCSIITDANSGTKAQRVKGNGADFTNIQIPISTDSAKYYIFICSVKSSDGQVVFLTRFGSDASVLSHTGLTTLYKPFYRKLNGAYTAAQIYQSWTPGSTTSIDIDSVRLYEITAAEYAKIDVDPEYTGDKLAEKFPYVDSVQHVTNPLFTKLGKNLLPSFAEWNLHGNAVATEPYKLTLNATANGQASSVTIPALPNQIYKVSLDAAASTSNGQITIQARDENDTLLSTVLDNQPQYVPFNSFTTPANTKFLRVSCNNWAGVKTYVFANLQIELGSIATSFEPYNSDYLYTQTTLAGNDAVKDSLTYRDGAWRKAKRWEHLALDGSLGWAFETDAAGFKRVYLNGVIPNTGGVYIAKHDGKQIPFTYNYGSIDAANKAALVSPYFYLSLADSDTGWGEGYVPSTAEIKAHFYGWKMFNQVDYGLYNGSGTKAWRKIGVSDNSTDTTILPTSIATGFTPYKISYQLPKPVEEIITVEGALNLHGGGNQVEVTEGIIVREKATPQLDAPSQQYRINNKYNTSTDSFLKNRASKILGVYRNGVLDTKWMRYSVSQAVDGSQNGNESVYIKSADYDPAAEYTVTYIVLDKYGMTAALTDVTAEYNNNAKTAHDQLVRRMSDVETNISVVVNAVAELYKRMKALGG